MSDKRKNRKTKFDIATVKVPQGVSRDETFLEIERQIVDAPFEVVFVLDTQGMEILRKQGTSEKVSLQQEENLIRGHALTHNHPPHVSFSIPDVLTTIGFNLVQMRAVTGNQVHVMTRPDGGWNNTRVQDVFAVLIPELKEHFVQFARKHPEITRVQVSRMMNKAFIKEMCILGLINVEVIPL